MNPLQTLLNWLAPLLNPLEEFHTQVSRLATIHQDAVHTFDTLASGLMAAPAGTSEAFTGELATSFWDDVQAYLNAENALMSTSTGTATTLAGEGGIDAATAVCQDCVSEITTDATTAAAEIGEDAVLDEVTGIVDAAAVAEAGANPIADVAAIILTLVAGAALLASLVKLGWDIYNAVQRWQRSMYQIGDTPLPGLPPNPTPVSATPTPRPVPLGASPTNQHLTPQQEQEANDILTQLSKEGIKVSQSDVENLVRLGYDRESILNILRSGSSAVIAYTGTHKLDPKALKDLLRASELAQRVINDAGKGKIKRAKNYHGRLPSELEQEILSKPDAVYVSTGKSVRFIFFKNGNIVVTEGTGSSRGSVVTSYGPGGPRGASGASVLGGSPNDPGLPVTRDMITKGTIPTPGGDTIPPAIPILP